MKRMQSSLCALLMVGLGCLLLWVLSGEGGAPANPSRIPDDSSRIPDDRPLSARPAVLVEGRVRGPTSDDEVMRTMVGSETTLEVIVVQGEAGVPARGEVVKVKRHLKGSNLILAMTDVVTDSDGRFRVSDIAGQLVVLQPFGGSDCVVDGDRAPPTVTLRLSAKRELAGTVVDGAGSAVPDATIWVSFDNELPVGSLVGKSNSVGAFAVSVPCGVRRYLWAEFPGKQRSLMYHVAPDPMADEQSIILQIGGAAGSIAVRVRGPKGEPIPGAFVELGSPVIVMFYVPKCRGMRGLGNWRGASADAEGCVLFDGVQCGSCPLTVRAPGFGSWRQLIVVEPGMQDLLIDLEAAVSMRGIVTAYSMACEGASVTWHPDGNSPKSEVVTNSDGLFVFTQLCAGWGVVEVRKEQGGEIWKARTRVLCQDGVVQDIKLSPMPIPRLLICDESGNALSGWQVLMLEDGVAHSGVTDDVGLIELRRECASRRVAVYAPFQGGWEFLPRTVQLLGDLQKVVVPNALAAPGELSGMVLNLQGGELGASRDLESWPGRVKIETDPAGRFRVGGVPPGSFVVWHVKDGFCHRIQTISIAPGSTQEVNLVLTK